MSQANNNAGIYPSQKHGYASIIVKCSFVFHFMLLFCVFIILPPILQFNCIRDKYKIA